MHIIKCINCQNDIPYKLKSSYKRALLKNNGKVSCMSCKLLNVWDNSDLKEKASKNAKQLWKNEEYRIKNTNSNKIFWSKTAAKNEHSKRIKELWKNNEYRNIHSESVKEKWKDKSYKQKRKEIGEKSSKKHSDISKKLWENNEYVINHKLSMEKVYNNDTYRQHRSENTKKLWKHDKYRDKVINSLKRKWLDKTFKIEMAQRCASQPRCSSLQTTLYSILDDLNIKYYREYQDKPADSETIIGPWPCDCVIPRDNKPWLVIECNGDYWHSRKERIITDKQKITYFSNLQDKYELKYIWEHEFKCKGKIIELIKYWMGITELELIEFNFKDIIIKKAETKDYKLLLSKYHYLPNAGRGGEVYGAYLKDKLIAVCVFSPLVRQNINVNGYKQKEIRELSRLCIHPKYQKKNFASWFVSRCIKQLDSKYKCIISYCDTTFNHDGAVYKAIGFKHDGIISADYWYVDTKGWVMHKKTLYNHAVKMGMKETEFAEKHGYMKVYGKEKLRFIWKRH